MIDAENHLMKHKGVDRDDNEPICPKCGTRYFVLGKAVLGKRGIVYLENTYTCLGCRTDFSYPAKTDPMAEDEDIPFRKERK